MGVLNRIGLGWLSRVQPLPAARRFVQTRASAVGRLVFLETGGRIVRRTAIDYETLAREGYEQNAIAHRCIRLIADSLKSTPLQFLDGDKDVTASHPAARVFMAPNREQIWEELLDAIVGHLHIAGEAFIEGVAVGGDRRLAELFALRPDKVSPEPGEDGFVASYVYEGAAGRRAFEVPARAGAFSPILHIKNWNPRDHWRGLSALIPVAAVADEQNEAVAHAKALYQNAARPSGALVFAPKDADAKLGDDQIESLRYQLEENHQGARNAGRPLLLDGGMEWMPMGFSPRDLEAGEGRASAARELALGLGVPPLLLGLPGDNTFANFYEAKLALWQLTVWPLATYLAKKLTAWVRPLYPNLTIQFDREQSPLAEAEKRDRWDRIKDAYFISIDEKRRELGYEPLDSRLKTGTGDVVLVPAGLATLEDVLAPEPDPEEAGLDAYGPDPDKDEKASKARAN